MSTVRAPRQLGYTAVQILSVAMAIVALSLIVGCRGQSASPGDATEVKVAVEVSPHPPAVGPAGLTVSLVGADGKPITDAHVDVEGTMSHAGMVPVLTSTKHAAEGRYVADDFRFTMGGDWIIIVRATLADGQKIERHLDVKGVSGSKMHKSEGQGGGSGGSSAGHGR